MIILEENFKWHLEAFAYELFICKYSQPFTVSWKRKTLIVWLQKELPWLRSHTANTLFVLFLYVLELWLCCLGVC